MRRNIFTSYIICNRLNLETFLEPIIYFIEIGNPRGPPPENRIWEFSLVRLKQKHTNTNFDGYAIESSKLLSCSMQFVPKIGSKKKNPKSILCDANAKNIKLARTPFFFFILSVPGPLNLLFPIFVYFCYLICCFLCVMRVDFCFTVNRNSLVKTLYINILKPQIHTRTTMI